MKRNPISKAFAALTWLVCSGPDEVGVREMASALAIAPSTAHRLLTALAENGFVQQLAHGRYALGFELIRIAQLATARLPAVRIALPHLRALVDTCNETALLGMYDSNRQQMMYMAQIESSHPLRYMIELNKWLPIHAGASGLAIMAFLPEEERRSVVARTHLFPVTERTVSSETELEQAIARIRAAGYAISFGERLQGAVGLAVPIFDPMGAVAGDVCLTIPEQRFERKREQLLVKSLKLCAQRITAELGSRAVPQAPFTSARSATPRVGRARRSRVRA